MFYPLVKSILFQLDPEFSHDLILDALSFMQRCPKGLSLLGYGNRRVDTTPVEVMGLSFPNRVGLAAGLDKNGRCVKAFSQLGFGSVEVGTVTPKPQIGNPKPRMFRIKEANALINRMGFNNLGVDALVKTLSSTPSIKPTLLGINIGKNKDTPNEEAYVDYLSCMTKVYHLADYIVVNISSPNTPGLRLLQQESALRTLLQPLKEQQLKLSASKKVPLVVKIAPDNTDEDLTLMAKVCLDLDIDGIIATNTTLNHESVLAHKHGQEIGGLSGKPLFDNSTRTVSQLNLLLQGKIPIIAVGGIQSAQDAKLKIDAGASLVQLYTGLIYKGPSLISEVVQTLSKI